MPARGADLADLEARLNALGFPYAMFPCPAAPGGRVLAVAGWEVSVVPGRFSDRGWFRVARFLTGETAIFRTVDEVLTFVVTARRPGS